MYNNTYVSVQVEEYCCSCMIQNDMQWFWSFRYIVEMDCVFVGAAVCRECCMTDHKHGSINCVSFIPLPTVQSY